MNKICKPEKFEVEKVWPSIPYCRNETAKIECSLQSIESKVGRHTVEIMGI